MDQIIKVAGSIAEVNYKANFLYFATRMLDIYTNCKIRLTIDKWISWENRCLGYELYINILRPFLQILVLTVADKGELLWQCRTFLGHHHRNGSQDKRKWKLSESQTWIPLTLTMGKKIHQGISTFSYSEFNPWILWMFTNLKNTQDSSPFINWKSY